MRNILFRGKRVDNGEWCLGWYFIFKDMHFILPLDAKNSKHTYLWDYALEVIPETVGQYTGMEDKNGKKVFEGDVIQAYNGGFVGCVQYGEFLPEVLIEYCKNHRCSAIHKAYGLFASDGKEDCIIEDNRTFCVIGNIHDNTANAVAVVHAEWIRCDRHDTKRCSVCDVVFSARMHPENYCPNCGSRMDGEKHR